jgi:hypothetical protein
METKASSGVQRAEWFNENIDDVPYRIALDEATGKPEIRQQRYSRRRQHPDHPAIVVLCG